MQFNRILGNLVATLSVGGVKLTLFKGEGFSIGSKYLIGWKLESKMCTRILGKNRFSQLEIVSHFSTTVH